MEYDGGYDTHDILMCEAMIFVVWYAEDCLGCECGYAIQ